jgi:hypothetical protein
MFCTCVASSRCSLPVATCSFWFGFRVEMLIFFLWNILESLRIDEGSRQRFYDRVKA